MESIGVLRKIDQLGRLVIPIELRERFHLKENDIVSLFLDELKARFTISVGDSEVGIPRPLDSVGRVVIPIDFRRRLKLDCGDPLEVFVDRESQQIILRKYTCGCIFCGSLENLTLFRDQRICNRCCIELTENRQTETSA